MQIESMKRIVLFILFIQLIMSCKDSGRKTLFRKIGKDVHGIDFQNTIFESPALNILTLEYIYNGGGVAVADFNNDGLSDVFFTGNMVPNRLYLNKGELHFEDVTEQAGIQGAEKWRSGVAAADVNGDGLMDLYVCATIKPDSALRANMLFINQGLNKEGIPVFKDEAAAYGVNFSGHSSGAAFLDYDNDSDLDLYVLTNTIEKGIPTSYRSKINDGSTINTDHLFRNNGNGTFTDVSKHAGILDEGYGLGVAIADINKDGWQDIYVSNDYITNDLLYVNNGNGTFTNAIDKWIKHQSQFSMGNDVADINNDGLPDIVTLDMLPEGNLRRKTVITGTGYISYINNKKYGYSPQYVRNMLQVNNGDGSFSEIGQLAGIQQTEWSWSPLFADFDNDGFRDLMITNGFPRDITDKDFSNFRNGPAKNVASVEYFLDSIPVVKVSNYAFKNKGDLTFKDATQEWGVFEPSFSNGASFADFDNDGDLDYIANDINAEVLFYENTLYDGQEEKHAKHFLRIRLDGKGQNKGGSGAKIEVHYDHGKIQYHDHSVYRGYLSTVEDVVHFGLDTIAMIDTVFVNWPDGNTNLLTQVKADQVLKIEYKDSQKRQSIKNKASKTLLENVTSRTRVQYVPEEEDKIDFNIQRTIPHKFSQAGPGVAVGDVNNDGMEDFYLGGAANFNGNIFLQRKDGTFSKKELKKMMPGGEEDEGALFFDADNDGDQDLYVVSGSYEYAPDAVQYQDRLYVNDGKGNLKLNATALPPTTSSGSCVRAADIDMDGDLDLFIGGRVIPGKYPLAPESYLLINDRGKFSNKTATWCPELSFAGMITDAIWTDYNNDGKVDLIVTGEFMPITVFKNDGNKFSKITDSGLEKFSGWWNSITGADFDRDGDVDFIAGNLGQNNYYKASSKTPLRVYAKDFDGNNSIDAVLSCYLRSEAGDLKEFPVHFWDELNSQSPKFRQKFDYYKKFGRATLHDLLTPEELTDVLILEANYTSSAYLENLGNNKFGVRSLPVRAQVAPVNGIVTADVNNDGNTDVLMIGNDYGNEVFTGRYDAFKGLVLLGNGKGQFETTPATESGLDVDGDGKALAKLSTPAGRMLYIATQNRDSVKIFSSSDTEKNLMYRPAPGDAWAELTYKDGKKQKVEFYFGSGYLSQSSRNIVVSPLVVSIVVFDSKGNSKPVNVSSLSL
jgi:hypothetical protein